MRRIEPVASADDLDIPMPVMAPAYRVSAARQAQAMDPSTRRLAIFAGVIGGCLLLLIAVWSFTGHRSGGVPVVEADSRPLRVKPTDPGGLQVAGANEGILSGESDGKAALAPPPETPKPQELKAAEEAAARPAPPPPPPAPTPTVARAEPPKPEAKRVEAHAAEPRVAEPPRAAPVAAATPIPPPTALAPAHPAAAKAAEAASGPVAVQLGSMDSEALARAEWERLAHRYGPLLAGHRPTITRFDRTADNKVFWRLRTSGFADERQAETFCAEVKAKGGVCSVAHAA